MPEETTSTRKPRKRLSAESRAQLIELFKREDLRTAQGKLDIPTIAKLTGASYQQVLYAARGDPYWHSQVSESDPSKQEPDETDLIDPPKPPGGVFITDDDFAKYQAILRQQQKMLTKDWEALGLDPVMAARVEKNSRIGGAPMLPVIGMLYGGLIKHAAFLDEVLELDAAKIKNKMLPEEKDKAGAPVEDGKVQREWRYCWYAGYKLNLEFYATLHKTQAILARVLRDMRNSGFSGSKPQLGVFDGGVSDRSPEHHAS